MAVWKLRSQASYRSRHIEVRAKFSMTVRWREALERRHLTEELSTYTTPRELLELDAIMGRYSDEETKEMRSILSAQAAERWLAERRGLVG